MNPVCPAPTFYVPWSRIRAEDDRKSPICPASTFGAPVLSQFWTELKIIENHPFVPYLLSTCPSLGVAENNPFAPCLLFTCPGLGPGLKKIANNLLCPVPTFYVPRASSPSYCKPRIAIVQEMHTADSPVQDLLCVHLV